MRRNARWSYTEFIIIAAVLIAGWRLDTENGVFQADDSDAHAGL